MLYLALKALSGLGQALSLMVLLFTLLSKMRQFSAVMIPRKVIEWEVSAK
jgi:hypothetical protein